MTSAAASSSSRLTASDPAARSPRDQDNRQDDKRAFASAHRPYDLIHTDQDGAYAGERVYVGAGTVILAVLLTESIATFRE
jgi:type IV secretory pathway VirB10-like protein